MRLVSSMEAADIVGCSRQRIWEAIHDKRYFPTAIKAGRMWLLSIEEVEAFGKHFNSKYVATKESRSDE